MYGTKCYKSNYDINKALINLFSKILLKDIASDSLNLIPRNWGLQVVKCSAL